MNPTIEQFNALLARVNQLDGVGLPPGWPPAIITKINADIAGLKETVSQVTLALDAQLNIINDKLAALAKQIQILQGVSS